MGALLKIANASHRVRAWFDRRVGLLPAVMERLDIDTEGVLDTDAGLEMWTGWQSCVSCASAGRCTKWIEDDSGNDPEGYRGFCPNAGLLDRLPRRRSSD